MSSIFIKKEKFSSIVMKFGEVLSEVERLYGERDKSYTILGIEVNSEERPKIVFDEQAKTIIVQISAGAMVDIRRALLQVSHLAVHCLNPTTYDQRKVLEEGLAIYFSLKYSKEKENTEWMIYNKREIEAAELVETAFGYDSDFIYKLRKKYGTLSNISTKAILDVSKKIPEQIAEQLTKRYVEKHKTLIINY